ncbi:LytR/AlgR family response regulator transcription factor [Portibacter marinus]|uniref:LytR/AlgR family response regulator transcription factor n=1 Tax=Portibacter marinus TaxID=2898660 RepID=UPI001F16D230|nr:LytTR family DNA-binding domain-containing protein [Portibacter marinus]
MRVVIVEDEKPAAQKLVGELRTLVPNIQILTILHDVESAIQYFKRNMEVDLVFMDIQLSDGISLNILDKVKIKAPIIFITAFDQYWQKALMLNGIDYLLKPITIEDLEKALSKFEMLQKHFSNKMKNLLDYVNGHESEKKYRSKFLVRQGRELVLIESSSIVYFKTSHKLTLMVTEKGRKLIMDESLVQLERTLDPKFFRRANRSHIININYIDKITMFGKGRMKIKMKDEKGLPVLISQEKSSEMKNWLEGKI